jgi:hypothetical protein
MDPGTVGVFIPIAAILAWGAVRIATIQAEHKKGGDPETSDRLHALRTRSDHCVRNWERPRSDSTSPSGCWPNSVPPSG